MMNVFRMLSVIVALGACSESTTSPAPAPPVGAADGGTSGVDGGPAGDAGPGSDAAGGSVLASQIDLYNRGNQARQLAPMIGPYVFAFEDGDKLEGTLRATNPSDATDHIELKRDFRRVGEKVTIFVQGLQRTCTVSAAAKDLTYVSVHLQDDPTQDPDAVLSNEIVCSCGFEENLGPQSCSR